MSISSRLYRCLCVGRVFVKSADRFLLLWLLPSGTFDQERFNKRQAHGQAYDQAHKIVD
jgi:hypothetical protein